MKLVEYKKDLLSSLPLISLIVVIDLVLVLLGTFLPFSILFISLIISFPSTVLAVFIKKRYYLLYVFIASILSFLVTFGNISFIIYYFLPSLLLSFIFSLGLINVEKIKERKILKIDKYLLIITLSFINLFIEIGLIYIGIYLFNYNFIEMFLSLFNLNNNPYSSYFIYLIIFIYSFINIMISYFFINFEIKKFDKSISFYTSIFNKEILSVLIIINSIFLTLSSFFFLSFSYTFLLVSFILLIFLLYEEIKNNNSFVVLIFSAISLIIPLILIAYLNNIEPLYSFLFLNITPLVSSLIYIIKRLIIYKFRKIK